MGAALMLTWFKRKLAMWQLNGLLKELEEHLEYQEWLEAEITKAQYRRLELLRRINRR
jgi:hypothetical protein